MEIEIKGKVELPEIPEEFRDIFVNFKNNYKTKLFLKGKWIENEDFMEIISPIDESNLCYASVISIDQLNESIEFLNNSQKEFRKIPANKRVEMLENASRVMENFKDFITEILVLEGGKPYKEAEGEVNASIERLKLAYQDLGRIIDKAITGEQAKGSEKKFGIIVREPLGVVAVITPFNYPLFTPIAKIVASFITGNCVIFKPSSYTPLTGIIITKILEIVGFKNYISLAIGGGGIVGDTITTHPLVKGITFTGSTEVGKRIFRIAGLKKLQLELGGKAPAIVMDDADLNLTSKSIVAGAYRLAGQRCDAISLVLIQENVYEELLEKIIKERENWKVGDPRDKNISVGPLINRRAVQRVSEMVIEALDKGSKLIAGGDYYRLYFNPTILTEVNENCIIAKEEIFGPVIPIIKFKEVKEAIKICNSLRYGLDSCLFTRDINKAWEISREIEVGSVTINDLPRHGLGIFPFGGVKDSGIGREGIGFTVEEVTYIKSIIFNITS